MKNKLPIRITTELVYSIHMSEPMQINLPDGFEWCILDHNTIDNYFLNESDSWRNTSYHKILESGCLGYLIYSRRAWASVGWVHTPDSMPPPHLTEKIIGNNYWTFFVHTNEPFRGRGLQKEGLKLRLNGALLDSNSDSCDVFTDVSPDNIHSRRAKLSVGFEPAGVIHKKSFVLPRVKSVTISAWKATEVHPPLIY